MVCYDFSDHNDLCILGGQVKTVDGGNDSIVMPRLSNESKFSIIIFQWLNSSMN